MQLRNIADLIPWDKNYRAIDSNGFKRLKEQILIGQFKPLLVTEDNIIIGGNMRVKAYQDMGISQSQCITIGFEEEEEGWHITVDGEPHRSKYFKTKEDAMMAVSLADNDRAGYYTDEFINHQSEYDLDWGDYAPDFNVPNSLDRYEAPVIEELEKDPSSFQILLEFENADMQNSNFVELTKQGYKGKLITK